MPTTKKDTGAGKSVVRPAPSSTPSARGGGSHVVAVVRRTGPAPAENLGRSADQVASVTVAHRKGSDPTNF